MKTGEHISPVSPRPQTYTQGIKTAVYTSPVTTQRCTQGVRTGVYTSPVTTQTCTQRMKTGDVLFTCNQHRHVHRV